MDKLDWKSLFWTWIKSFYDKLSFVIFEKGVGKGDSDDEIFKFK